MPARKFAEDSYMGSAPGLVWWLKTTDPVRKNQTTGSRHCRY